MLLHRAFRFAFPLHDQPDELRATRVRNTYPQHHDKTHVHARVCASNLIECPYFCRLNMLVPFGFVAPLMFDVLSDGIYFLPGNYSNTGSFLLEL